MSGSACSRSSCSARRWPYFAFPGSGDATRLGYVYEHFRLYAGLAAVAPGALLAIESAHHDGLPAGARAALCDGVALYLVRCATCGPGRTRWGADRLRVAARLGAAGVVAVVGLAGAGVAPVVVVWVVAGVVVGALVLEPMSVVRLR